MATDPALAIQGALVSAIKAIPTLAGNNVFDLVPTANPFPRVTVGIGQSVPDPADCRDATESFWQIDAWSREPGFPQVKTIADSIRDRLHDGNLSLSGHRLELMLVELTDYTREADGVTSRARISLRAVTSPAT